jgi:hypothetical protein
MAKLLTPLEIVWQAQQRYNDMVREKQPGSYEEWMKNYLLGVTSEMNEVLNEINWKAHRHGRKIDRTNLARELADLTKYVFSLWEWSSFGPDDMLHFVNEKSAELEAQWTQDFATAYPSGCAVVISDIDGTLADYRQGFIQWLIAEHNEDLPPDSASSLAMEIDLGLSYPTYVRYKEEFEASGGYHELPVYPDVPPTVQELAKRSVQFIAYTARPAQSFSRIWNDTWGWLNDVGMESYFSEVRIGKEQRIARACELKEAGHPVVLLEDEPDTALRAAHAGILVFLRAQPYNAGIMHDRILRCGHLEPSMIWSALTYLKGAQNVK